MVDIGSEFDGTEWVDCAVFCGAASESECTGEVDDAHSHILLVSSLHTAIFQDLHNFWLREHGKQELGGEKKKKIVSSVGTT